MGVEPAPRIVYCGMFGTLSRMPLAALLDAGYDIRAVIVPAAPGEPPVRQLTPPAEWVARPTSFAALLRRTIVDLAWERALPVLAVGDLGAAASAAIAACAPDLIAVSCFPHRFPTRLLALPPLGVLNLHPALLPRGRGPDPLFWAFREPDAERAGAGGVTIHLMDRGLDSGPIVAQGRVTLTDGMSASELELHSAALGAELLVGAIEALTSGSAELTPQNEGMATTYPLPGEADFVIRPDHPARWVFNCLRGLTGRGPTAALAIGERRWPVRAALGYDPAGTLPQPYREDGATLRVRCAPGVLTVVV
ncbi:MAG TPA: formyltransferase family protein [Thermomicrobiales bacterium]|jgi:methionyl-tRNA formyltransferase